MDPVLALRELLDLAQPTLEAADFIVEHVPRNQSMFQRLHAALKLIDSVHLRLIVDCHS
jgi:hypothetical protein